VRNVRVPTNSCSLARHLPGHILFTHVQSQGPACTTNCSYASARKPLIGSHLLARRRLIGQSLHLTPLHVVG
jgi:hypothetical protein